MQHLKNIFWRGLGTVLHLRSLQKMRASGNSISIQLLVDEARLYGYPYTTGDEAQLRNFISAAQANANADFTAFRFNERIVRSATSGSYSFTVERIGNTPVAYHEVQDKLKTAIEGMIRYTISAEGLKRRDKISFAIVDPALNNNAVSIPYTYAENLSVDTILDYIESTMTSEESVNTVNTIFYVKYVKNLRGGIYAPYITSFSDLIKRKRFIVEVVGDDYDCFFKCVALGLSFHKRYPDIPYEVLRKKRSHARLAKMAQELRVSSGYYEQHAIGLSEMTTFESIFCLGINVLDIRTMSFIREYVGGIFPQIYLLFIISEDSDEGHFHFIQPDRINTLFNRRRFCIHCKRGYNQDVKHICFQKCLGCETLQCGGCTADLSEYTLLCDTCGFMFYDQACMNNHRFLCATRRKCTCGLILRFNVRRGDWDEHYCGKYKCSNCVQWVDYDDHECYHQVEAVQNTSGQFKVMYYDYECAIGGGGAHYPVGIVVSREDQLFRFHTTDEFADWLFTSSNVGYTVIAHNGGRYDIHFIKELMIYRGIKSFDIVNGNSYFYCYVKDFKIRFVDSCRFISGSLRSFTKTFGLNEVCKGYFPYRFFTTNNIQYRGPMPGIEWFDFDMMTDSRERRDAEAWYEEHKNDVIDLYEMCMRYCESDVILLREGCEQFRQLMLRMTGGEFEPFGSITIAGLCHKIYRRFFLPEKTIGVLNTPDIEDTKFYCYWLTSMMSRYGLVRDTSSEPYDLYNEDTRTVHVYARCVDSGCIDCFNRFTNHPTRFLPMYAVRHVFNNMTRELKDRGFTVSVTKECDWKRLCADPTIQDNMRSLKDESLRLSVLNINDAFFGGHVEPIKMYYKCRPGEKIRYYDFTSLYPSVQYGWHFDAISGERKSTPYPVGHPERITSNFKPLSEYFGFVMCHVIPPKNLYHPVLAVKKDGKLVFDLQPCWGTWSTIEVILAMEKGYIVDEVLEVLHFPEQSDTLFRGYVKEFLKLKQESAGWEKMGCTTDEEKTAFIRDYAQVMDIDLNADNVSYNPGLYYSAKLMLNSLWGKYGQRDSFSETIDTFKETDFQKIMFDDTAVVNNVIFHHNNARTITYEKKAAYRRLSKTTNKAIAAYTTAYARMRLYRLLDVLGERVLYMDTDSVIFVERDDEPTLLNTGPYLGDLTDELSADDWITEFVSTGPKSYAYRTQSGKTECKVKGFTLNARASMVLNMDSLKRIVCHDHSETVTTQPLYFDISPFHSIKTREWGKDKGKVFRLTYDKRVILWDNEENHQIDTVPFGYSSTSQ